MIDIQKRVKQRDTAIDFVKFIAVFFVLNSHMGECYSKWPCLATGGAIGDSLFFFASGFTLILGNGGGRFDEWYKRRIRRIYPSLIAAAIVGVLFLGKDYSFTDVLFAKQYWFVQCILFLYPLLFLAKKYVSKHVVLLIVLSVIIMAVFPFAHTGSFLFWGGGYYRWAVYILFMLLGAIVGKERERISQMNVWASLISALSCALAWYGICYLFHDSVFLCISDSYLCLGAYAVLCYLSGGQQAHYQQCMPSFDDRTYHHHKDFLR